MAIARTLWIAQAPMRTPFALFALASCLLGTEACTSILGLDEYKPLPKDGGADSPSDDTAGTDTNPGADTDPGTCEPFWKRCDTCMAKNCVPFWTKCMQPGQACDDLHACDCTCGAADCWTACSKTASGACQLCVANNDPFCYGTKCGLDCPQ
jgi:hypothetical protein